LCVPRSREDIKTVLSTISALHATSLLPGSILTRLKSSCLHSGTSTLCASPLPPTRSYIY
jgi:hypothetical protein